MAVARKESKDTLGPRRELSIRGKKPKASERGVGKGDGSVVLVSLGDIEVVEVVLTAFTDQERYIHS